MTGNNRIRTCAFCRPDSRTPWQALAKYAPGARQRRFSKGATIYEQGGAAEGVFVLCRGSVALLDATRDKQPCLAGIVFPGQPFGLDCLTGEGRRNCRAQARQDSVACYIPASELQDVAHGRSGLLWGSFVQLAKSAEALAQERALLTGSSLSAQLDYLHRLYADRDGTARLKQKEVAALLGVAPETVCREIRKKKASSVDKTKVASS
jgi:CRP-like cAMP-binding protein